MVLVKRVWRVCWGLDGDWRWFGGRDCRKPRWGNGGELLGIGGDHWIEEELEWGTYSSVIE